MKPFLLWLLLAIAVWGGASTGYHLYLTEHPRRILIAVDTSYPMTAVWNQVPGVLNALSAQPYTEYSLVTEKGVVHGWSQALQIGNLSPYAPRDFYRIAKAGTYSQEAEASNTYLITNARLDVTASLNGWEIIRLED